MRISNLARTGVAVAAVLTAGCNLAGPPPRANAPPTTAAGGPAASTPPARPGGSASPGDHGVYDPATTAPDGVSREVADKFVHAWARPNLTAPEWYVGVAPYATPSYAEELKTVESGNVPASAITGSPQPVSANPTTTVWTVATNAGAVQITCALVGNKWLVSTAEWKGR